MTTASNMPPRGLIFGWCRCHSQTYQILNPLSQLPVSLPVRFHIPISLSSPSYLSTSLLPLPHPFRTKKPQSPPQSSPPPPPAHSPLSLCLLSTHPHLHFSICIHIRPSPPPTTPTPLLCGVAWCVKGGLLGSEGGGGGRGRGLLIISVGCYIILIGMRPGKTTHIF